MRDFSQAEKLYVDELRAFRTYLQSHTSIAELKALNLLGVQFALCEASKARVFWFGTGEWAKKSNIPVPLLFALRVGQPLQAVDAGQRSLATASLRG